MCWLIGIIEDVAEDEKGIRAKRTLYIFGLNAVTPGSGMPSSITRLSIPVEKQCGFGMIASSYTNACVATDTMLNVIDLKGEMLRKK